MRALVPRVHAGQHRVALVDDPHRRFGDGVELAVGDDQRDFDDPVAVGLEPGHFEVDPDETARVLGHSRIRVKWVRSFSHTPEGAGPAGPIVTASLFAALFVAALLVSLALHLWLARRHVAFVAAHRDAVPAAFAERIGLAAHQKAADYTIARTRFGVAEMLVETVAARRADVRRRPRRARPPDRMCCRSAAWVAISS